jgi:hypothetical protein
VDRSYKSFKWTRACLGEGAWLDQSMGAKFGMGMRARGWKLGKKRRLEHMRGWEQG